jgi:hypothetical protein
MVPTQNSIDVCYHHKVSVWTSLGKSFQWPHKLRSCRRSKWKFDYIFCETLILKTHLYAIDVGTGLSLPACAMLTLCIRYIFSCLSMHTPSYKMASFSDLHVPNMNRLLWSACHVTKSVSFRTVLFWANLSCLMLRNWIRESVPVAEKIASRIRLSGGLVVFHILG